MKWLPISISFFAFSLPLYSQTSSVLAQSYPTPKTWQISQKFKPRVDDKANPPTVGAATRGSSCLENQQEITPLLPVNKSGLTFNDRPTFFVHIPLTQLQTAEFSIIDAQKKIIYKTNLTLPQTSGIISFTLPQNSPPLKVNTSYRWYLTLICDSEDSSTNPYVEGLVKVIPADVQLSDSLAKADLLQKPTLYAQAGIWYEALANLVKLRCTQPDNLTVQQNWQEFLASVELNNIATASLLNSCTTKN
ncbi:DUF928 domain-containing protein [Sphaerospermopsis aphanizomenoides BCCUSP55]|uniref:DUF928 domain-containing protein n=1 Tax=Sphaerospermopsis aphanizomenoides TaxID=459663 RepID=UPI001902E1DD|nr:DUF928 domain-containing protein [Sphaerospermopsis aphanizomenoides]MBK1990355.1 DUF928 domain-containing protein [Sphaerospermopsis aphanizomenoides BCCUSP55]